MNKTLLLSAAALAMFGFASCTNENYEPSLAGSGEEVNLSIELPGNLGTRAFGDGTEALNLYYAVYKENSTEPLYSNFSSEPEATRQSAVTFTDLKATVTLKLAVNQTYSVVMWAESYTDGADDCPYVFDAKAKTITVDYNKMGVNSEVSDAFYAVQTFKCKTDGTPVSIKLYRPFAQINVGTNDMEEAVKLGFPGLSKSKVQVDGVPNVLNMSDGTTSGSATAYSYSVAQAAVPGDDEVFPVGGNDYISMVYVLAPKGQKMLSSKLTIYFTDANNKSTNLPALTNVPMQANYRTNIFGSLLLKNTSMNVEIVPAFGGAFQETLDENVSKWDGATVDKNLPNSDAEGEENVLLINSAEQLAGFAQNVAEGKNYSGKTIRLMADINLAGHDWTPVNGFSGTFDGNGHTIYNLHVDHVGNSTGMFGNCISANFNNITIDGAYVKSTGKWNGVLLGYSYSSVTKCVVKNATLEIPNEGGIICGFQASDSSGFITGCKAIDCTIIARSSWDVGQIAGSVRTGSVVDCEAVNVTGATKLVGREI